MELICDTVKFAVVQIISDRQQANRFARGTNTYNNPCVCAAVDRIGARPLNQIIAREHLTHSTERAKTQSVGRRRRRRTRISVSLFLEHGPRSTKSCTCGQHRMQLILFIYLFAYFVERARRVYKARSVSCLSEQLCEPQRDK